MKSLTSPLFTILLSGCFLVACGSADQAVESPATEPVADEASVTHPVETEATEPTEGTEATDPAAEEATDPAAEEETLADPAAEAELPKAEQ